MRRGVLTIYMSLVMAVMVSVITVSVFSVKVSADRAVLATSSDQALFSGLARYDRELLEKFDVFFIDGGCGTSRLALDCLERRLTNDMEAVLHPHTNPLAVGSRYPLSISPLVNTLDGFTLATDAGGHVFCGQAVAYMKKTLGIQGISLLLDRADRAGRRGDGSETEAGGSTPANLSDLLSGGGGVTPTPSAVGEGGGTEGDPVSDGGAASVRRNADGDMVASNGVVVPADMENALTGIEEMKTLSVLRLVTGDPEAVSKKKVAGEVLAGGREYEKGMGVIEVPSDGGAFDKALFDEYILEHFGSYTEPWESAALAYPCEYILFGKDSDIANLEKMVNRLLLVREGINLAFLAKNPKREAELTACAECLAALLMIPAAEPAVKALLMAGWAFLESLVDVRALLMGREAAWVKSEETWQVSMTSMAEFLVSRNAEELIRPAPGGVTYRDYLLAFLLTRSEEKTIPRSLAMVEAAIRAERENFRIDHCISSLSVTGEVVAEGRVKLTYSQTLSYGMLM